MSVSLIYITYPELGKRFSAPNIWFWVCNDYGDNDNNNNDNNK
jgi:hypothetical protein